MTLPDVPAQTGPVTTTGELALPVTSDSMLHRFGDAARVPRLPRHPVRHDVHARRASFRPRRRDLALMWTATGTMWMAGGSFVVAVFLVR